jgi:CheY-like chemotaxis protein
VIETAIESIEPDVEARRHHLAVNVPEEPLVIDGDLVRLTQIFTNLLSNAIKYTPPGGRVRVSAERLGLEAVVRVSDDGNGIAPEHLPHLFEMFYRTEGILERTQGGLGIGLALVRHLVELHGGTVDARSDGPGRGSEFTVRLPLTAEPVVVAPGGDGDGALPHLAGRRVLVVDDNEDAAASLGVLLAHAGAEIFTAGDGEEAISVAARVRPDIVLLDIGLPKINGYDVARVIRERLGSSARLIALTGWGQDSDRERSKQAGFDHHLIKPVDPEALLELVRDLDGSTADETEPREPFPA